MVPSATENLRTTTRYKHKGLNYINLGIDIKNRVFRVDEIYKTATHKHCPQIKSHQRMERSQSLAASTSLIIRIIIIESKVEFTTAALLGPTHAPFRFSQ